MDFLNEILNYKILQLGEFTLKVSSILMLLIFIIFISILLRAIKKTVYNATKIETGKRYAIYNLIKYFTLVLSFLTVLQIVGFNLSVLLAGSAALLVGLGLGLQNLFSDFISGIILLVTCK